MCALVCGAVILGQIFFLLMILNWVLNVFGKNIGAIELGTPFGTRRYVVGIGRY